MQGTRRHRGGGRGEKGRELLHSHKYRERQSPREHEAFWGERSTAEKGFIFYSYYLIVPCNIPVIKACDN